MPVVRCWAPAAGLGRGMEVPTYMSQAYAAPIQTHACQRVCWKAGAVCFPSICLLFMLLCGKVWRCAADGESHM